MSYPQSVAYTAMFKVVLSSDHVSDGNSLTMAVTISKAGGAFGNPSAGAVNATFVSSGWYKYTFSSTDMNTVGDLVARLSGASADNSERIFSIVNANNGGLASLPDTPVATNGSLITTGTGTSQLNVASGKTPATIAAGDLATDSVDANALKADAVIEIQNGLATTSALSAVATNVTNLAKLVYATGTATAGSSTTITPAVALPATNSAQGFTIVITGGTGVGQSRVIASNTTTVLTIDSPWITNPDATSVYVIFATRSPIVNSGGSAAADLRHILNFGLSETTGGNLRSGFKTLLDVAVGSQALTIASKNQTGDAYALIGTTGSGLTSLATQASVTAISTTIGAAGAGLTGIVSIGSVTNPIVLPTMPTDWITAVGLSAGAVAEIQTGLATSTAVGSLASQASVNALPTVANIAAGILKNPANLLYTEASTGFVTATNGGGGGGGGGLDAAGTRAALGLATANLDAQLKIIQAVLSGHTSETTVSPGVTAQTFYDPANDATPIVTVKFNTNGSRPNQN